MFLCAFVYYQVRQVCLRPWKQRVYSGVIVTDRRPWVYAGAHAQQLEARNCVRIFQCTRFMGILFGMGGWCGWQSSSIAAALYILTPLDIVCVCVCLRRFVFVLRERVSLQSQVY